MGWFYAGVWQYYESLAEQMYERLAHALDRFGLRDIAEEYRLGRTTGNTRREVRKQVLEGRTILSPCLHSMPNLQEKHSKREEDGEVAKKTQRHL